MANTLYPAFKQGLLNAEYDLNTASIKASLVRGASFNTAHAVVSDVTGAGGTINATSAALGSPTITSGVFDAADTTISATANATDHVLLVYQSSAVTGGADVAASSQKLIAWIDTGTNLPIQPGTGTVTVTFDNGSSKIFAL